MKSAAPLPAATAQIGFGQVRHTRHRPQRNAFAYPTYFLMLPMRSLRANGAGTLARNRRAALSFQDADHGDGRSDSLQWLEDLLGQHGIDDAQGEIWLHTYPRVLGYVFNPASFYLCRDAEGSLGMLVVDAHDDIYVTGESGGITTATEYATLKYSSAGVPLWTNRYDGPSHMHDNAVALGVDASGNITVPGRDPYGGTGEWSFRRNREAIVAYWRAGASDAGEQNSRSQRARTPRKLYCEPLRMDNTYFSATNTSTSPTTSSPSIISTECMTVKSESPYSSIFGR